MALFLTLLPTLNEFTVIFFYLFLFICEKWWVALTSSLLPFKVDYNLVRKFTDPNLCAISSPADLTSLAMIYTAS